MPEHRDPTFRNYLPSEAESYGTFRLSYPAPLYEHILAWHAGGSGAGFGQLLDVGCGPGNATRDMARAFEHAVGVDPGAEMIATARQLGGDTKTGESIRYEVCGAESCASAPGIEKGSVDLVIAAMAAHWFDMPQFWAQAAAAVKPGGTVALWTISSNYAPKVNEILLRFERETLAPHETPGNQISRDMYDNLVMPWAADPAQTAFPPAGFHKDEWDRDGVLTGSDFFGADARPQSLDRLEQGLGTASMVTRWRAAHPDLAHTERDCVKVLITQLRDALGVHASEGIVTCGSTAILLFRRA